MKNFIQPGDVIEIAAPAAVSSGDGVMVGTLFGVATHSAASGAPLNVRTRGVFDLAKTPAQAWTVGAAIYWDATNKVCTTSDGSGANTEIGNAVAVAANPSATGTVRLNG